jgi:hypothetical protein
MLHTSKSVLFKQWYVDGCLVVHEEIQELFFSIIKIKNINCTIKIVSNVLK